MRLSSGMSITLSAAHTHTPSNLKALQLPLFSSPFSFKPHKASPPPSPSLQTSQLYNYGGKVVTNRMHGYLRMRIAQFLTTVHTTPHIIYLSRHGQSECVHMHMHMHRWPVGVCAWAWAWALA